MWVKIKQGNKTKQLFPCYFNTQQQNKQ